MRYVLDEMPKLNNFHSMTVEDRIKHLMEKEEYTKFCRAYIIVVRYMVQFHTFKVKPFKKYIKHLMTVRPTEEEKKEMIGSPIKKFTWLNKQKAMYAKWMYMETDTSHNMKEANKLYHEVLDSLNKDSERMADALDNQQEIEKTKKIEVAEFMKQELLKQLSE